MRQRYQKFSQKCCPTTKQQYSAIEDELTSMPDWPPVSPTAPSIGMFQFDFCGPSFPKYHHNANSSDSENDGYSPKSSSQMECLLPDSHSETEESSFQLESNVTSEEDGSQSLLSSHIVDPEQAHRPLLLDHSNSEIIVDTLSTAKS